jgi:putative transposase
MNALVKKRGQPMGLAVIVNGKPSVRAATRTEVMRNANVPALQKTTTKTREKSMNRDIVLNYINELMAVSGSLTVAVDLLLGRAESGLLPIHINAALKACAAGSASYPSKSSLCLWHKNRRDGGIDALIPQYKGRVRNEGGWEALATDLYNVPSKVAIASVHKLLTEVHGFDCTYTQVKDYINALPAQLGKNSPARLGKNLERLTQQSFLRRTTENLRTGDIYAADGYCLDVYLTHPISGGLFRAEMTACIDVKSRYLAGYRLDENEGAFAVQSMWAETFHRHQHVCVFGYVDNGSGYKNHFVDDETVGFYSRVGMSLIHAIPGNPHGKGWIERFFRIVKEDFLRNWRPEFFCGHEMAADVKNKSVREFNAFRKAEKKGVIERTKGLTPPTVAEFMEAFDAWLVRYHNRPHPEQKNKTRLEVWQELVRIEPASSELEMKYRAVLLTVRRSMLKHGVLEYKHPDLYAFNGQKVMLEYDMTDSRVAVVRLPDGRWVCDAHLITPMDVVPVSRMDEMRTTSAKNAIKKLQLKIDEKIERKGVLIDGHTIADNLLELTGDTPVVAKKELYDLFD